MLNIFIALAFVGGLVLPMQALINARFASEISSPIWAAFISFTTGTIILGLYLGFSRTTPPTVNQLTNLPSWMFIGGLIGAFLS